MLKTPEIYKAHFNCKKNCTKNKPNYNEGNILDTLSYIFTLNDTLDTLTLSGRLEDAYTLNILDNIWVMLFNEDTKDSLIFNSIPDYISKTDKIHNTRG